MKRMFLPYVDFDQAPKKVLTTKQVEVRLRKMIKQIVEYRDAHSYEPTFIVTVNENGKNLFNALKEVDKGRKLTFWKVGHISIDEALRIKVYGDSMPLSGDHDSMNFIVLGGVANSGRELNAVRSFLDSTGGYQDTNFKFFTWVDSGHSSVPISDAILEAEGPEKFFSGHGLNIERCPDYANGELWAYPLKWGYADDLDIEGKKRRGIIVCAKARY